jgi:rubrerythrin
MKEHFYQNYVEPIVHGLLGLCTDRRRWVCKKCGYVSEDDPVTAEADGDSYRCHNPVCGALTKERVQT